MEIGSTPYPYPWVAGRRKAPPSAARPRPRLAGPSTCQKAAWGKHERPQTPQAGTTNPAPAEDATAPIKSARPSLMYAAARVSSRAIVRVSPSPLLNIPSHHRARWPHDSGASYDGGASRRYAHAGPAQRVDLANGGASIGQPSCPIRIRGQVAVGRAGPGEESETR